MQADLVRTIQAPSDLQFDQGPIHFAPSERPLGGFRSDFPSRLLPAESIAASFFGIALKEALGAPQDL